MGRLYVIATPIGNLEDLSPRAARVLGEVALVVAEDTREARKLLGHAGVRVPVSSYHAHSGPSALEPVMKALTEGDVAYVSDAGTPAVSDPGPQLVRAVVEKGHEVIAVPGPSAVTAALSVSGLPADSFLFLGFLPRKPSERRELLQRATTAAKGPEGRQWAAPTLVLFEAPHRLRESLEDILGVLGDRRIAVCRELTKLFEETFRGTVKEAIAHFTNPRGEFVVVLEGGWLEGHSVGGESTTRPEADVLAALERLRAEGLRGRRLVEAVCAETGAPRSKVYRLSLELEKAGPGRPTGS